MTLKVSGTRYEARKKTYQTSKQGMKLVFIGLSGFLIGGMFFWSYIRDYFHAQVAAQTLKTVESNFKQKSGLTNHAKNLRYEGVASKNQPYILVAKEGTEYADHRAKLRAPYLTLQLHTGEKVSLRSDKAIYYKDNQMLEMIGNVILTHSTGYEFKTSRAWANIADSSAFGDEPVTGYGPQRDIFAPSGFLLTEKGNKIKFKGRPVLNILP